MTNLNKAPNIWLTSDLHFCHDRAFVYEPRGFSNIEEMNHAIVERWNAVVQPEDIVYVLGDIMLNNNEEGVRLFNSLNGYKRIILGNHDTATRQALYKECKNVESVELAAMLKYKGYHFFMTHYPCITSNLDYDKPLRQRTFCLCGHKHTKNRWDDADKGYIYHCELDAHDCYPILIDNIINDFINFFGQ